MNAPWRSAARSAAARSMGLSVAPVRVANLAAKALLIALLAHAALFPDLSQYQHKGMGFRIALYPIAALVGPLMWVLRGRRRPYLHLVDLCVVLPFLIDTAGNTANLYDTVTWWDDAMHVVTWIPWVTAVGLLFGGRLDDRLVVAGLTVGFGAVTHILWEVGEYLTFVSDSPTESLSAYRDTIGDLTGSLLGSCLGAALVARVLWDLRPTWPPGERAAASSP
jgi:hypothetical protein